jgi:hypothetical protein
MSTKSELIAGFGVIAVGGVLLLGLANVPAGPKARKSVRVTATAVSTGKADNKCRADEFCAVLQ